MLPAAVLRPFSVPYLRKETPADYRIVEELTREAFWGNIDHPTCDGEHLLVHKLRKLPAFVPELDFVAEAEGKIVGHIIYSLAKIMTPDKGEIQVLNFGPLSVHPSYKRMGVGSALLHHSIAEAARLGYRAIIFYGHPDYYPRFGFRRASRYDIVESDMLTADNMKFIAEKTGTTGNKLWQVITEKYNAIRSRIDALPRTLTYNDFYWTNLIVSKTGEDAFMFDYNLLGKGIAYGDIRNVVSSLSPEAAEAFIEEYGCDFSEEEKKADAFIAPLVTLVCACRDEVFPSWAEESLEELKNGDILRHLKEWI